MFKVKYESLKFLERHQTKCILCIIIIIIIMIINNNHNNNNNNTQMNILYTEDS